MLTLPKLNWFYSMVDEFTAICTLGDQVTCKGSVQIGSLTTLSPDDTACIDDTECHGRKQHFD